MKTTFLNVEIPEQFFCLPHLVWECQRAWDDSSRRAFTEHTNLDPYGRRLSALRCIRTTTNMSKQETNDELYMEMHVLFDKQEGLVTLDTRRQVYEFINHMGLDPNTDDGVSPPLDPHEVYSKADSPPEIDVELRDKVWQAHCKLIHLAIWTRPDLVHSVSVLGRFVHDPSGKLLNAFSRIAKHFVNNQARFRNPRHRAYGSQVLWSLRLRLGWLYWRQEIFRRVHLLFARRSNQLEGETKPHGLLELSQSRILCSFRTY